LFFGAVIFLKTSKNLFETNLSDKYFCDLLHSPLVLN